MWDNNLHTAERINQITIRQDDALIERKLG